MTTLPAGVSALLVALLALPLGAAADDLKVGDPAPDFSLQASDGQTYSLSKLRGQTVVLAWFPKAFTAG
jgi:peroxiredoxin Q/BCP